MASDKKNVGKFSRAKGKRGERKLATELREAFPHYAETIKRGWQTRMGSDDPDVVFPGYWLEHKSGPKPNPRAALTQAITESNEGLKGMPVAVIRDDGKQPFAVLRWSDLITLMQIRDKYEQLDEDIRTGSDHRGVLRASGGTERGNDVSSSGPEDAVRGDKGKRKANRRVPRGTRPASPTESEES